MSLQGITHSVTGGYWECQKCGTSASNKDAFSSLCLEGNCSNLNKGRKDKHEQNKPKEEHAQKGTTCEGREGNTFQKQQGSRLKKLQAEIKRAVKKDKQSHIIEQFRENKEDKHKKHLWKAIKAMKTKFTPRYIQMKNRNGTRVHFLFNLNDSDR